MKGTAISVSESNGVSDGVGCRQTFLFRLLKDQEEHSTLADWFLDLVACFIFFSELPQQIFVG
jgi:hypothetical protein